MIQEDLNSMVESLHPLEINILFVFEAGKAVDDNLLIKEASIEQSQKDMAIGWLLAKGILSVTGETVARSVVLTEAGARYFDLKIPALRIFQSIKANPDYSMSDVKGRDDIEPAEISSAVGLLKEKGIIKVAAGGRLEMGDGSLISEFEDIQRLINVVREKGEIGLAELSENEQSAIEGLHRKRGKSKGIFRINEKTDRTYNLTDTGINIHSAVLQKGMPVEEIAQLTPQMLKDGSWEGKSFRKYNISLPPPRRTPGGQ